MEAVSMINYALLKRSARQREHCVRQVPRQPAVQTKPPRATPRSEASRLLMMQRLRPGLRVRPKRQGVTMSRLFPYLAVAALLVGPGVAQIPYERGNPPPHEATPAGTADPSFHGAMAEAMDRMTKDMAINHTGNPDHDFAAMMIPHHQGAIDMAKVQLQFGRDPILRRLAQAIIVEQQQEIDVMRQELSRLPSSSSASAVSPSMHVPSDPVTREP
jgi:hypothetical protein